MDTPVFSIGVGPPRRRRGRRPPPPNVYNNKWFQNIPEIQFFRKAWLLKKPSDFHMEYTMATAGYSIVAVLKHLNNQMRLQSAPGFLSFTHPTPESRKKLLGDCIVYAKKNQRMRQAFRCLLNRWLTKRLRPVNEEDLMTGEIPKVPIRIVAWAERRTYNFEASTILRDMCSRLLQHDYLFAKFSKPRNPYTNQELTHAQFFSVVKQLRAAGQTNWLIEGLYTLQYDMDRFKEQFSEAVKVQIINNQFKNLGSEETIDIIHEFIEDQHEEHGVSFNSLLYRWGLANAHDMLRIKLWTKKCKEYHMLLSTVSDPVRLGTGLLQIRKFTGRICSPPTDIVLRKEKAFKNKLLVERGHEPEPEAEAEEEILPTVIVATVPNRFVFNFNIPAVASVTTTANLTEFWANATDGATEVTPEISGEDREASELVGEDREASEISGEDQFTA